MIRNLAVMVLVGAAATTNFSQSKKIPRYAAAKGLCGTVYNLENTPSFFDDPKTKSETEYVIRVLKSAPPQADVQCRDFTDAWAPYLYANRKVEIAGLLIKLKRYREAREELWSLFLDRPVLYGKRKLYYNFGTNEAVALLVGRELWDKTDIEQRLQSSKYRNTSEIKKAYQKRLS